MNKSWLLSAVIATGVAGFVPTVSSRVMAADRDREEWVKYEDTPKAVRQAIDKERGNHEVKRIDHVTRNGREFWRATIDTKGEDTVVRVDSSGKVLGRDEVADTGPADLGRGEDLTSGRQVKYADLPRGVKDVLDKERGNREIKGIYEIRDARTPYYRAIIDERNGDRVVRVSDNGRLLSEEDVREVRTAGGRLERSLDDRGESIAFDRLPGDVKTALGREAGPDRVRDVQRLTRDGRTVYRAEITNGDRSRTVLVDANGRLLKEADDTASGRREVAFRDLPGPVKDGIGREIPSDKLDRITQVTRNGQTYYRAQARNGDTVTVDDRGRVVRDLR
jgi:uncharacterized membrane protein YkoI